MENTRILFSILVILQVIAIIFLLVLPKDASIKSSVSSTESDNPSIDKPSDNPRLRHKLVSNLTVKFDDENKMFNTTVVKTNSRGWRDSNYPLEPGKNTFRVAAVGDSVTFGYRVNLSQSYPKQLETRLQKQESQYRFQVLNFGVPSYNAQDKVSAVNQSVIDHHPDAIILQLSGNDETNFTRIQELRREISGENSDWGSQKIREKAHLREARERREGPANETMKPVKKELRRLHRLTRPRNIDVLVFMVASRPDQIEVVEQTVSDWGWEVEYIPYGDYRIPKDGHPTPRGHGFLAGRLEEELVEHEIIPASN